MIDDSDAEIAAIQATFSQTKILICLWHVTRAWNKNIKSKVIYFNFITFNFILNKLLINHIDLTIFFLIKIPSLNNMEETRNIRNAAFLSLKKIMNSENEQEFVENRDLFLEEWREYPRLTNYFETEWLPKKEKWCKAWRTVSYIKVLIFFFH